MEQIKGPGSLFPVCTNDVQAEGEELCPAERSSIGSEERGGSASPRGRAAGHGAARMLSLRVPAHWLSGERPPGGPSGPPSWEGDLPWQLK